MPFVLVCLCLLGQVSTGLSITPDLKDDRHVVVSIPLSVDLKTALAKSAKPTDFEFASKYLQISVVNDETEKAGPAIFARYQITATHLVLKPKYPLLRGVRYQATANIGDKSFKQFYKPAEKKTPAPKVTKIFPTNHVLPANCLKFYVHFSKPMREGRAIFEQIEIRDAQGKVVHDPWRRTELWSADARRLTLWIHPGRIKQGVNLREEFGPVLKPNQKYQLIISQQVRCADGVSIEQRFAKSFRTVAESRTRPLPVNWKVKSPAKGTRKPLVIEFDRTLDAALAPKMISVFCKQQPIVGKVTLAKAERIWMFQPETPWLKNEYQIRVNGELEDVAGNTPLRVFDTDLKAKPIDPPELMLRFTVNNGPLQSN